MQNPQTVLQPSEAFARPNGMQWRLHCPECGAEEIERGDFDEATGQAPYDPDDDSGGDEASVTVHPDNDSYDSPFGTRGGYVEVRMWCAGGHAFRLIVANHKGAEFIGVLRGQ